MHNPLCITVNELLSLEDCRAFIAQAEEQRSYRAMAADYPSSYRDNDRLMLDSPALAASLFDPLQPRLPKSLERGNTVWRLQGLNSRFRGCRYSNGQHFTRHRDGAYQDSQGARSFLTVMLYLNDASEFQGGETRFYADRFCPQATQVITPRPGMAVVFDHALWHDGQPVLQGTKYVLRTDVMYQACQTNREGHQGYVFALTERADGRLASGSRDKTVRLWSPQGHSLATLHHHQGSVTALASLGSTLWSGSRDRHIALWNEHGHLLHSFPAHQGAVLALTPLADGRMASAGADDRVRVWSSGGHLELEFESGRWPWSLIQHSRGELLVGADDGTLNFLDLAGGRRLLAQTKAGILSLLESRQGSLYAGGSDGTVQRWHSSGQPLSCWKGHQGPVTSLLELDDGRLVSGSEDDGIRLWEGGQSRELTRHQDFVRALCLTRTGRLASASYDGTIGFTELPSKPATMALTERAANPDGVSCGTAAAS